MNEYNNLSVSAELHKEYNELQNMYDYFTINLIFGDITTYAKIRSYTSKKEVYTEVYKLFF
jgi:hypothetical protein